jgi:hypothetical protein
MVTPEEIQEAAKYSKEQLVIEFFKLNFRIGSYLFWETPSDSNEHNFKIETVDKAGSNAYKRTLRALGWIIQGPEEHDHLLFDNPALVVRALFDIRDANIEKLLQKKSSSEE